MQTRCAEARVIDGAGCDDVRGELIHISLAAMPEGPAKSSLLAFPTGGTLQPEDVDQLVAAGESAVAGSTKLREFLAGFRRPQSCRVTPAAPSSDVLPVSSRVGIR